MKKHIIINVGRQLGSGGRIIGNRIAEDFNIKFYDKELLDLAAKESGLNKKFFERNDEHKGFLKVLFSSFAPIFGNSDPYANQLSDESLFKFQSDAIRKAAEQDSCVFVGRCADYILRDYPNTVSIFITADMPDRIKRVCTSRKKRPKRNVSKATRSGLSTITITVPRHGEAQNPTTFASTRLLWV